MTKEIKRPTQAEIEEIKKRDKIEAKISHGNHNIGTNAFVIKEAYRLVAKKAGVPNASKNLYKYLGCTPNDYDNLIASRCCPKSVINGLITLGVPENCMRKDHATLISMSKGVENLCWDKLSGAMELSAFRPLLETSLLCIPDKDNMLLLTIVNQMVRVVYNEMELPADRVADFFDALSEIDIDGKGIKQKDLYNDLVKIAESYIYDDIE